LPGVGKLLTRSLLRRDLPVLMAIVVFVSLLIVFLNLIVDLIYGVLDPRVRAGRSDAEKARSSAALTAAAVVRSREQPA
ncbi:MAG TPA: ABC transporter permease subunit, partial [Gaiellaceae bacterium]